MVETQKNLYDNHWSYFEYSLCTGLHWRDHEILQNSFKITKDQGVTITP